MPHSTILVEKKGSLLHVTLNRPQQRNALNDQMIYELTTVFSRAFEDPDLRVIFLEGNGPSFCAGADVNWMKRMAQFTLEQNEADAHTLAHLLHLIFTCPIPIVASAHGHVYGGAVGILAACDSVVADKDTLFCLSEVKLGIIPATIYPYLLHRMGAGPTTHLSLTAIPFNGTDACLYGLVHEAVCSKDREERTQTLLKSIRKNSPAACKAAKALMREILPIDETIRNLTSKRLSEIRISTEGQEGLSAFLEKRSPSWIEKEDL
jgi:methylglutaconyl-CoA hydratase